MEDIAVVIASLAGIFLVLIVLVQNPKGGGLASSFSSANQIGGVRRTTDFLEKATWSLAIGIVLMSLVATATAGGGGGLVSDDGFDQRLNDRRATIPTAGETVNPIFTPPEE